MNGIVSAACLEGVCREESEGRRESCGVVFILPNYRNVSN